MKKLQLDVVSNLFYYRILQDDNCQKCAKESRRIEYDQLTVIKRKLRSKRYSGQRGGGDYVPIYWQMTLFGEWHAGTLDT